MPHKHDRSVSVNIPPVLASVARPDDVAVVDVLTVIQRGLAMQAAKRTPAKQRPPIRPLYENANRKAPCLDGSCFVHKVEYADDGQQDEASGKLRCKHRGATMMFRVGMSRLHYQNVLAEPRLVGGYIAIWGVLSGI